MIDTGGAQFSASYRMESAEISAVDYILSDGVRKTVRRAVVFTPVGDFPRWTAGISSAPPLSAKAHTGDYSTPIENAALLVDRGSAFWVEVEKQGCYTQIPTSGEVVQIVPLVNEGLMLLVTSWSITALSAKGMVWSSDRISIEGIRIDEVDNGWIRGVADPLDTESRDFAVELATGTLIGGINLG